jgi:hypothetical protein
MFKRGRK